MTSRDAEDQANYDRRQYRRMLETIESFEGKQLSLHTLISNLESLLESLRSPDAPWSKAFRKEWAKIEDSYAFALDQGSDEMDSVGKGIIDQALLELKELIAAKL